MALSQWSGYDARMYKAINDLPKELENKFLNGEEFRDHFRDFHGRPVQDIVEALNQYGQRGYFEYAIMLDSAYLERGKALDQVTAALNQLRPKPIKLSLYNGLTKLVYSKASAGQTLTLKQAITLPDEAKSYLEFKLFNIDRTRLLEELAIYNYAPAQPSRLVKSGQVSSVPKLPPLNISKLKLDPGSYDKRTGVLHLAPYHERRIAGKVSVKRPKDGTTDDSKYFQCYVMERVFKTKKTLKHGVEINSILGIHKRLVDKTTTIKIRNAVSEINRKIASDGGPKNLIKIQNGKVFLNNSYL